MRITTQETNAPSPGQQYAALVTELDRAMEQAIRRHLGRLRCRPGCSRCCKPFSVLAVEAALLQQALSNLAPATRDRLGNQADHNEQCPFLIDDLCAVYDHRPLICRTQGLAVAYIDHDRQAIEVSACPLNFPDDFQFDEADLFFLDSFNARLAAINREFCARQGLSPEERFPMAAIAGLPGLSARPLPGKPLDGRRP